MASNSSLHSPNRDDPGLLRLLLRRSSTSLKEESGGKQFKPVTTDEASSVSGPHGAHISLARPIQVEPSATPAAAEAQPGPGSAQAQQHHLRQGPRTSSAAAAIKMPSATPQPPLKKKTSFRDRLKAWQRAPPDSDTAADETAGQPRFVYEPRHAAADFERLAVPPLSPAARPRHRPMQTLTEEHTALPPDRTQPRTSERGHTIPGLCEEDSTGRYSRSFGVGGTRKRHSYTAVENPPKASQATAHGPGSTWPMTYAPGAQPRTATVGTGTEDSKPASTSPTAPLSDYELFIARAEAEDRAYREQILQSISHNSPGVKPDPHRQYASAAATRSYSADMSDRSRRNSDRYVLSGGDQHLQQQQDREENRTDSTRRIGHTRHASWSPRDTADGKAVEWEKSPVPRQRRNQTAYQPITYSADRTPHFGPQPSRTLRKQASFTQRIAEYIRPPKIARPVETLIE